MSLYPTAEIQWKDGPASLPAGAKVAVLEGDPSKEGFLTMRLLLPDGFKIPPLASESRACDRHLGKIQCRNGRQI